MTFSHTRCQITAPTSQTKTYQKCVSLLTTQNEHRSDNSKQVQAANVKGVLCRLHPFANRLGAKRCPVDK